VKQSGGHIELRSTVNSGTSFTIYLPRAEAASERMPSAEQPAARHPRAATVLLVEDDPTLRKLVAGLLRRDGHDVLSAANGADALRLAQTHGGDIDLLITDVVMPGMSGREVVESLRTSRPDMAVLYMSGYTDDAVIVRGVSDLRNTLLQKPFTAAELARKVTEVLERPGNGS
jgi:DNA-binding response OmpR family regulator